MNINNSNLRTTHINKQFKKIKQENDHAQKTIEMSKIQINYMYYNLQYYLFVFMELSQIILKF